MTVPDYKISAVIITHNEATNIKKCLASLKGVADEIIVLDAFSIDATPKICRSNKSVFFIQREWMGYSAAKNFANSFAHAPYILSIDADEILSETLKTAILNEKEALHGAYKFSRRNHINNQAVLHSGWYPDEKIRLFPKEGSQWVGDFVHETLETAQPVFLLDGDLLHFGYKSVADLDKRFQKYAELGAIEMFNKGKHLNDWCIYCKVFYKFFNIYFLHLGFLDGIYGWAIATKSAKATLYKYRKLKNLYKISENPAAVPPQYQRLETAEKAHL